MSINEASPSHCCGKGANPTSASDSFYRGEEEVSHPPIEEHLLTLLINSTASVNDSNKESAGGNHRINRRKGRDVMNLRRLMAVACVFLLTLGLLLGGCQKKEEAATTEETQAAQTEEQPAAEEHPTADTAAAEHPTEQQ
jgi:hypothetical protein